MLLSDNELKKVLTMPSPLGNEWPVSPGQLLTAWRLVSELNIKPVKLSEETREQWTTIYKPQLTKRLDKLTNTFFTRKDVIIELCRLLTAGMGKSWQYKHCEVICMDISNDLAKLAQPKCSSDLMETATGIILEAALHFKQGDLFTSMTLGEVNSYLSGLEQAIMANSTFLRLDMSTRKAILPVIAQLIRVSNEYLITHFKGTAAPFKYQWINAEFLKQAVDHPALIQHTLKYYYNVVKPTKPLQGKSIGLVYGY